MSMPYSAMPSPRATKISALPKLLGSSVSGADGGGRAGTDGDAGADAGDAHGQGGGDQAQAHVDVGRGGCGLAVVAANGARWKGAGPAHSGQSSTSRRCGATFCISICFITILHLPQTAGRSNNL